MQSIATPSAWIGFTVFVVGLLVLDLTVFHRKAHEVHIKEALAWSAIWIAIAIAFGIGIYAWAGSAPALEFYTGYLIEKALSVDNLFVFLVIFSYFSVPPTLQHRVLFWGILGAMVMRAIFIFAGAALLSQFHWLIYVFGAFLLWTGLKLLLHRDAEVHPERNPLFRFLQRVLPTVSDYRGAHFTIVEKGKRYATPLLVVLIAVEASDILFAVDSVPAIFGVTEDPFVVYTSNIFAILGLRALYFVLAGAMSRFCYLKIGLAMVLIFIGGKMLASIVFHVPVGYSLAVVAGILAGAIVVSLLRPRPPDPVAPPGG